VVPTVTLEGLEINIPPKGERPEFSSAPRDRADREEGSNSSVLIQYVSVKDATLVLLPRDVKKIPLRFPIHDLKLTSAGPGAAMKYHAMLKNPRPPGEIHSYGTFGPWKSGEPGDTPLSGDYVFEHADLGVFVGVAGILKSTGRFEGQLNSITASGQATVPDFRLKRSGNRVPLVAKFEAQIDGTNGNTILKPVVATLGSTHFTTSGAVFKNDGDRHRQIRLDVIMPNGDMGDVLRLAMKGAPFMEGRLFLKTRLDLPPLNGKVKDKLRLEGRFEIREGKFLRSTMQDQIDGLSRRGQGQPKNQEIDEVVSRMTGAFKLEDAVISFSDLAFGVPGADVSLNGSYNLDGDKLDFHGALKLQAKVSQTMTGWKHWLLKPVDPFFAKNGAGTFLKIKVVGSSKAPKFGAGS
jgi:AsmA-like C-terminal region